MANNSPAVFFVFFIKMIFFLKKVPDDLLFGSLTGERKGFELNWMAFSEFCHEKKKEWIIWQEARVNGTLGNRDVQRPPVHRLLHLFTFNFSRLSFLPTLLHGAGPCLSGSLASKLAPYSELSWGYSQSQVGK